MNAQQMLTWCRSSDAQHAIENFRDELREKMLKACMTRTEKQLLEDYDDALDLIGLIGGGDRAAFMAASFHTSVIKEALDRAMCAALT